MSIYTLLVFSIKKYPSVELSEILDMIAIYGKFYKPVSLPQPISEVPDDDKFITCALAATAKNYCKRRL